MPIDWTDKAIKAALRAYAGSVVPDEHGLPRYNIRAALDAAVKAQGLEQQFRKAFLDGYLKGKLDIAAAIRALAETEKTDE